MLPYSERSEFKNLAPEPDHTTELDYFFSHAYHDMRFFLEATTRSSSAIYTYFGDLQKNMFYISDNLRDTFGFPRNIVMDFPQKWKSHIYEEKWKLLFERDFANVMKTKSDTHDLRYQVIDKNGNIFWIHCYGELQWDSKRKKPLFVAGRLVKQDDHFSVDPLTNFPTEETLHHRLSQLRECQYNCRTIGFSLNCVSEINAKLGRTMGDRLIQHISKALTDRLIGKMTFYRLLGMRCMAIIDNNVKDSSGSIIGEIRSTIEDIYKTMDIQVDRPCSFAVMKFPNMDLDSKDFVENMVSLIKLSEQDSVKDYIDDSPENLYRIREYAKLQIALSHDVLSGMNNFRAVIQPIVSAETGLITSGETLMRWNYNERGISPGIFIPILEKNRLIYTAGQWIIRQAIQACSEIIKYIPDFYLTVNLSLQQLDDPELIPLITKLLDYYHLDGGHFVIEITESSMDRKPEKLQTLINICTQKGIRLALDDFGTGYSSIHSFMHYNTDIVKIDRSMLVEIAESEEKINFVGSMIDACHKLGKLICIEGVETEQQKALCKNIQCDYIQGFYYYRPSAVDRVIEIAQHQMESESAT